MRVTILTIGTQGDVRPFVALGVGLRALGHEVRIASNRSFSELVTSAGLEFAPLTADFLEFMASEPDAMARGLNPLVVLAAARRRLKEMAAAWADEGRAACHDADLLIGNGMVAPLAASLAEALGKPYVESHLQPVTPCADIPPMMLPPPRRPLPGVVNRCLYHLLRVLTWQVLSPAFNGVVRRQLGLRAYPWVGPYYQQRPGRRGVLYGYSGKVVPRPEEWSRDVRVAGYWFLDQAREWQPPAELSRFLAAGPKPIYIGFGSMLSGQADEFTDLVIDAVRASGRRAIIATGWGGLVDRGEGDDRILFVKQAPHDWLFPRVELAVHHGGAGTTAAAVRAGIPSVVVPFFGDQPFWAWRLEQLGVAPPRLDRKTLTASALAGAIAAASAETLRGNARRLGEQVRAEDGVAAALQTLAEWGLQPPAAAAAC